MIPRRASVAALASVCVLRAGLACASAVLAETSGKVDWRARGAAWASARPGQTLDDGTQLRDGPGARSVIGFEDGSRVELGPDSTFTLERASAQGRSVSLALGYLRALIQKPSAGFETRTPTAVVAVRGTDFSVKVDRAGKTKVRVYSGVVSVKDGKGRETLLQANQSLGVSAAGAGGARAEPAAVEIGASGWTMDPPEGFAPAAGAGEGAWIRETDETVLYGIHRLVIRRSERVQAVGEPVAWQEGAAWPSGCRPEERLEDLSRGVTHGKPLFSYACVEAGGRRAPRQRVRADPSGRTARVDSVTVLGHYFANNFVAWDFDGRSSRQAVKAVYAHSVTVADKGTAPNLEEVQNFVGTKFGGGKPGPSFEAFLEALATLRPPSGPSPAAAAPAQQPSPEPKAVPLLR